MARLCTVEDCRNNGHYCRIHKVEEIKPATSIKKESEAKKEQLKIYRKVAAKYLARHKNCELKMDGCEVEAKCIHHKKGREGDLLTDEKFFAASCYHCNLLCEIKDAEARSKDIKLSKFNLKTTNA